MPTTKDFKLEELSKYFHLPEKAVAKELGICLTSLKKICRSYGESRKVNQKHSMCPRTLLPTRPPLRTVAAKKCHEQYIRGTWWLRKREQYIRGTCRSRSAKAVLPTGRARKSSRRMRS